MRQRYCWVRQACFACSSQVKPPWPTHTGSKHPRDSRSTTSITTNTNNTNTNTNNNNTVVPVAPVLVLDDVVAVDFQQEVGGPAGLPAGGRGSGGTSQQEVGVPKLYYSTYSTMKSCACLLRMIHKGLAFLCNRQDIFLCTRQNDCACLTGRNSAPPP